MTILIDLDSAGNQHVVEISDTHPLCDHPDGKSGKVKVIDVLKHHNANPKSREVGGWHVVNQLPGEPAPITRWQRFVNAVNALDPKHELRQIGFK